jgi:hypothetical protein
MKESQNYSHSRPSAILSAKNAILIDLGPNPHSFCSSHVGFLVDLVALGQVSLRVPGLSPALFPAFYILTLHSTSIKIKIKNNLH